MWVRLPWECEWEWPLPLEPLVPPEPPSVFAGVELEVELDDSDEVLDVDVDDSDDDDELPEDDVDDLPRLSVL